MKCCRGRSAPARELWIEMKNWYILCNNYVPSAPARELWIEIDKQKKVLKAVQVSSCEGAVD